MPEASQALRRSLYRLRTARDGALAAATIPAQPGQELTPSRPEIDADLWAQHVRYARHRDEDAFSFLLTHYRPYADALARRHRRRGEPVHDLIRTAVDALRLALRHFDPEDRRPFLPEAQPTITAFIQRHHRDAPAPLRHPHPDARSARTIRHARTLLEQDLGRTATPGEVADLLDLDVRELAAPDAPLGSAGPVPHDPDAGTPDSGTVRLEQDIDPLEYPEDRDILRSYLVDRRSQPEIAKDLGRSETDVARLLRRAIRQMRHPASGT